jgi:hypothetical protein
MVLQSWNHLFTWFSETSEAIVQVNNLEKRLINALDDPLFDTQVVN